MSDEKSEIIDEIKSKIGVDDSYIESKYVDAYYEDNEIAKSVIRSKYLNEYDYDNLCFLWYRLAKSLDDAQLESYKRSYYELKEFYSILEDFKYIFGGRINYGLGNKNDKISSLNNCYFINIEKDSLDFIYSFLYKQGKTFSLGGGVGTDITVLRPRNTKSRSGSSLPGSTAFMDIISNNTDTISQNNRRGASLISISCYHPDVLYFIDKKNDNFYDFIQRISRYDKSLSRELELSFSDRRIVSHSNISVKFDDKFMKAVENDDFIELYFPDFENCKRENNHTYIKEYKRKYNTLHRSLNLESESKESYIENKSITIYDTRWNGDLEEWRNKGYPIIVYTRIKARDIWSKFCESAHRSAEPGILFEDRIKENWTSDQKFLGVNPCGEINLSNNEPCCLGHQNLVKYVNEEGEVDTERLLNDIYLIVYMQDLIIECNRDRQSSTDQKEKANDYRRLGIGITGLADFLLLQGKRYDDPETIKYCEELSKSIALQKWRASADLARVLGRFKNYNKKLFLNAKFVDEFIKNEDPKLYNNIKKYGVRNVAVDTIAPVGTGSIITSTSSGIEPLFSASMRRRVKNNDGTYRSYEIIPDILLKIGVTDLQRLPDYVVTAHDVNYESRVEMQSVWQKYLSNSISSTINLPRDIDVKTVENIYMLAYKKNLKGISIYREGSRSGILSTEDTKVEKYKKTPAIIIDKVINNSTYRFLLTLSGSKLESINILLVYNKGEFKPDINKFLVNLDTMKKIYHDLYKFLHGSKDSSLAVTNFFSKFNHIVNSVLEKDDNGILDVLRIMKNNNPVVGTLEYTLLQILSEYVENGEELDEENIFENGCIVNRVTGETYC